MQNDSLCSYCSCFSSCYYFAVDSRARVCVVDLSLLSEVRINNLGHGLFLCPYCIHSLFSIDSHLKLLYPSLSRQISVLYLLYPSLFSIDTYLIQIVSIPVLPKYPFHSYCIHPCSPQVPILFLVYPSLFPSDIHPNLIVSMSVFPSYPSYPYCF